MLDVRRNFNLIERYTLFLLSEGYCQRNTCGRSITFKTMSIDHIIPHYAGGLTTLLNGQALCRSCNSKKGSKLTFMRQSEIDFIQARTRALGPNLWQIAVDKYPQDYRDLKEDGKLIDPFTTGA